MNKTSNSVLEEEARTRAEQQELRRQMFINVEPYVSHTLNINPHGYSNPFAFPIRTQFPHQPNQPMTA